MAWNPHTLYACNIATAEGVDLLIDQVSSQRISSGIALALIGSSGAVDPTFVGIRDQRPSIELTTSALATVLASCGVSGLKISADVDDDGAEFWFQKIEEAGTRATGSNHMKLTVKKGLLVPLTIRAPHNGLATLDLRFHIVYDGTNEPIVIAASQALEGTPSVGEAFTAGKVSINGSELEGVQNIEIDFGITVTVLGASGAVWPTFVAIQERRPEIRIQTADPTCFNTYGLDGTAQGATDSIVYLRKLSEGGTRVADNVAEHLSFTVDEGIIFVRDITGGHNANQTPSVVIQPTYDGTNAQIVISTATTIV